MDSLNRSRDLILDLKNQVERFDDSLFQHFVVSPRSTYDDEKTRISIIMTSHNRSKQVYFTLKTISASVVKNVQVILVDDSTHDPVDVESLRVFPFSIDLIRVIRDCKKWHNPCVNYNVGFRFIRGNKIVIQNSEVCHVGDVLRFVSEHVLDDHYYVLDVKASRGYDTNERIWESDVSTSLIFDQDLFSQWYQSVNLNRKYHFLTTCTLETFNKIGGFSYDYTMGSCFDDDDLVLKIMSRSIPIVNLFHTEYGIGGIHQFHGMSCEPNGWDHAESNESIFRWKQHHYKNTGKYIDLIDGVGNDLNEKNSGHDNGYSSGFYTDVRGVSRSGHGIPSHLDSHGSTL